MRPPQPRDDNQACATWDLESPIVTQPFAERRVTPWPSRSARVVMISNPGTPPPAWFNGSDHTATLEADARALSAREQATAAALKRLEERAAQVAASREQAYCDGKTAAESRLFWFGALFGGLTGAALTFVHLMSGGVA